MKIAGIDRHHDPAASFRRFEDTMRKLVRVPKKKLDAKIAEERRAKRPPPKPV